MAKAVWYRDVDPDDDSDPFADITPVVSTPSVPAEPSDRDLEQELRDTIAQEAALDALGVTCPIKNMPESVCHACPVRRTNPNDPLKKLCDIGVRQEEITTLLAARKHGTTR